MVHRAVAAGLMMIGCGGSTAGGSLDTTCPRAGPDAGSLLEGIAARGWPGPPDTAGFRLGEDVVLVAWKNLLSGRALTLSCAYLADAGGWTLVRRRVDDGTHTLRLSLRATPPAVVYRDAEGRLLEELSMPDKFNLEFEGREYTVQRGDAPGDAAKGGGAPVGRDSWYITLGPKAITSLESVPGESDDGLRTRIRRWLADHPEMPDSARIVLGGG